ncbi:hypothetical protein O6H91_12G092400 [Diphasiastrum complanatum]|uniref:Uncharacterized protein n=1 Tax=Diphasiastrum complanatum TaxID=34168 RepID=A0ACC2C5S2_DIPCM|nr:hypothetical protein O6H91_12G092400 [Diphasiastrum complanatum]
MFVSLMCLLAPRQISMKLFLTRSPYHGFMRPLGIPILELQRAPISIFVASYIRHTYNILGMTLRCVFLVRRRQSGTFDVLFIIRLGANTVLSFEILQSHCFHFSHMRTHGYERCFLLLLQVVAGSHPQSSKTRYLLRVLRIFSFQME